MFYKSCPLHLTVIVLLALTLGCKDSLPPVERETDSSNSNSLPTSQFVGSEACKRCHQELCDKYAGHPMSYSTREVASDNWRSDVKNLPARVSGANRLLTAQVVEEQMVHSELMFDGSGALIYEQPHAMKFVVGSGARARAYLEERDGQLFMSPLNWYRKTESWSLAPGYRADDVRRFDRRANEDCLSCHTGRVEPTTDVDGQSHLAIVEASIGCERCHGAGSNHIDYHDAKLVGFKVDPIQNLAKFTPAERDAVCYQCHLSASARVPLPGKHAWDFQPGMKLSEVWAILDYGTEVSNGQRTRSVNHVQQMRDSRCFKQSADRMSCTTCHDPHQIPQAQTQVEYYREKCINCHKLSDCTESGDLRTQAQDDCIKCHMPRLDSSNMTHVAQTDHRILRNNLNTDSSVENTLQYFADTATEFSSEQRQRGLALGTYIHCTKKGIAIPDGLKEFMLKSLENFPTDALLLNALGSISLQKQDLASARKFYNQAVQADEGNEAALDGQLEVACMQADWAICVQAASKLIQIDPTNVRAHAYRGDASARLGKIAEGIQDLEVAVKLNPGEPMFRQWLIEKYTQLGKSDEALQHAELLRRIQTAKPTKP